jgi:uncharacterized LabA/DUF88 family protein
MVNKSLALIDGFNYYHKLKNYQKNNNVCVKWLNYQKLISNAIKNYRKNDKFDLEVIYFSAYADHRDSGSINRHKIYVEALEKSGVKIVLGEFKKKFIDICPECKQKMPNEKILKHEEKHTDVNIAITMLEKAFLNEFDDCYLLSEDNDYVPVVKRVKELFPNKIITVCPPPQKRYFVYELITASGESDSYRFKWNQIKNSQFPDNFDGLINPWQLKYTINEKHNQLTGKSQI